MLEGITAGFILSLSLFPGTVWLARVGAQGSAVQTCSVGLAFALSQFVWLAIAVPGLLMMTDHLGFLHGPMHWFAAFVLGYMAFKFFRSRRARNLFVDEPLPSSFALFKNAFNRSLAMPMRLPAAMAILLATGVYINHPPDWFMVPITLAGVLVGIVWWWGQLTFLSVAFARKIPERITLRSINKIRPFCAVLFAVLSVVVFFLGF